MKRFLHAQIHGAVSNVTDQEAAQNEDLLIGDTGKRPYKRKASSMASENNDTLLTTTKKTVKTAGEYLLEKSYSPDSKNIVSRKMEEAKLAAQNKAIPADHLPLCGLEDAKRTKAGIVDEEDVPKKRGPGRPRKEEGITADTTTPLKKGPGRPRKVDKEKIELADDADETKREKIPVPTSPTPKKRGRPPTKKPKLFLKPDSSSDSSSNSGDEESEQVNVTNNSSSIHNKHCRHSKDTVIHDQTSLSAMNPEAIVHNVPQNLPRDLKDIMNKAFKLKKKTNEKSDDSKESIDNNLILFRRKQKEDIFNENLFISFGQIVTHQHKMIYILKEDVKTETKSSEGNFLLLPLQLLMRDDVANSSSFIYVSALSQMYTYLLFCPDITKCPWVAEMLKKKCSYTSNKNVQCLLLLHSPTIIDMKNLQKAIDEADKDIVNDTDDEDYYKVGFNGDDEYWSSIVVMTGCLFTVTENQLTWEHSLPTNTFYTQFLHLQQFLINIAVNGSLVVNTCVNAVVVNTESHNLFEPFLKHWDDITQEDTVVKKAFIGPGHNTWDTSFFPTIESLINHHYTDSVKEMKQLKGQVRNLKNVFNFNKTIQEYIDTNAEIIEIIDVINDNTDNLDDEDNENEIICRFAESMSLDLANVIELLFDHGPSEMTNFIHSKYSVEDIVCSQGRIQFNCQIGENGAYERFECDSFKLCCKCCGGNVFKNDTPSGMDDILKVLPDAMFCHIFKEVVPNINQYLFDQDFDQNQIKQCGNADHVIFLDALVSGEISNEGILDILRVNRAIFQRRSTQDLHPFVKMMCSILHNALPSNQTKEEIIRSYISSDYHCVLPSSKKRLQLDDAISDKVQRYIKYDDVLMKQMKEITMIDWSNDDNFKQLSNSLPVGEKWECLNDFVGKGKQFPYFHHTGLLPHLMNKKNQNNDCELTKAYNAYPPASWIYACMCANKYIKSEVYIAEVHISPKHTDTLKWIRKQRDIIELKEDTIDKKHVHVFQFVLGDDMVSLYSFFLKSLKHNVRTPVTKQMKCAIKSNTNSYKYNHEHNVMVTSTSPFRAQDILISTDRNKKILDWMHVRWLIDSIHGHDTSKGYLLTQLLSSPCFIETGLKYTRDSTCQGCPKESETSTLEQSIQEQPTTIQGGNPDVVESETYTQEQSIDIEEHPTTSEGGGNLPASVGVGEESRRSSKCKHDISVSNPSNKKPGLINTKATPGCRMESKTEVYPRPNNHSHNLAVKLSPKGWNCLYGNTHNTMHALGHGKMFTNKITTPATLDNNNYFSTLVSILRKQGYCVAFSRLMTNDNSLKFKELDKCINSAKVPSLIILNITYSGNQSRRHLIGIVPSVMIDKRTEMHIVDGYNKDLKSFPLNEENLNWCCSGCVSFFIEQFVFFTPGKQFLRDLSALRGPNDNSYGPYDIVKSTGALQEFIPVEYRNQKNKRKR